MLRVYKFCLAASLPKPRCHICDSPGAHFQNDSGNSAAGEAGKQGRQRRGRLPQLALTLAWRIANWEQVAAGFRFSSSSLFRATLAERGKQFIKQNMHLKQYKVTTNTLHIPSLHSHTQCIFIQFELTPLVINCASEMYSQVSEATWNLAQLCQRLFKGISFQLEVFRAGQTNRNQLQTE